MMRQRSISTSVSRLAISLLLLLSGWHGASAQGFLKFEKDTIPMFRGFAVSFDLVGFAQMQLSDYGQYEGALRLNLHDQYFPIVEVGLGRANHQDDDITGLSYKTTAPYFRIGADVNIMKNKHTGNRIFAGIRYAYTNYEADIARSPFDDPVWKWYTSYDVRGQACYQHWAELLFGIDARVFGPFHLGWNARYRLRLAHKDGWIGNMWYVPGYGLQDTSTLGASFYASIDI